MAVLSASPAICELRDSTQPRTVEGRRQAGGALAGVAPFFWALEGCQRTGQRNRGLKGPEWLDGLTRNQEFALLGNRLCDTR